MTAKEYLNQARELDKQIKAKHQRIAMLRDRAQKATGTITALRLSGTDIHSKLEDAVCDYIELQSELAAQIVEFHRKQREIAVVIGKVGDVDCRVLLEHRYLNLLNWEQVAAVMNYSYRHVTRLHGSALAKVKHVLECPI